MKNVVSYANARIMPIYCFSLDVNYLPYLRFYNEIGRSLTFIDTDDAALNIGARAV
ncbi:hypothetical protein FHS70_001834 [Flammeovirga yaeyamensis]|nr:hypothetical protein [Flammeovirga yaeyamensis]